LIEQGILMRLNDRKSKKYIASYYKGDIARLWSSRQRNEYYIDVNNAG